MVYKFATIRLAITSYRKRNVYFLKNYLQQLSLLLCKSVHQQTELVYIVTDERVGLLDIRPEFKPSVRKYFLYYVTIYYQHLLNIKLHKMEYPNIHSF